MSIHLIMSVDKIQSKLVSQSKLDWFLHTDIMREADFEVYLEKSKIDFER